MRTYVDVDLDKGRNWALLHYITWLLVNRVVTKVRPKWTL